MPIILYTFLVLQTSYDTGFYIVPEINFPLHKYPVISYTCFDKIPLEYIGCELHYFTTLNTTFAKNEEDFN